MIIQALTALKGALRFVKTDNPQVRCVEFQSESRRACSQRQTESDLAYRNQVQAMEWSEASDWVQSLTRKRQSRRGNPKKRARVALPMPRKKSRHLDPRKSRGWHAQGSRGGTDKNWSSCYPTPRGRRKFSWQRNPRGCLRVRREGIRNHYRYHCHYRYFYHYDWLSLSMSLLPSSPLMLCTFP